MTNALSKNVTVSVNVDGAQHYSFTVEIPNELNDDAKTLSLVGTSPTGKRHKLGGLALATMELLQSFGHATCWESRADEGSRWTSNKLDRLKWKVMSHTSPN
jgi:hypothetical protein